MSSEFKTNVFDSANMIVVLSNVIFFIVVQTMFFKYVASKQFNIVLEDKAGIVGEYLKYDPNANEKFRRFKNSEQVKIIKQNAKKQEALREKENAESTMMWIGIPLLVIGAFLIFFVIKLFYKQEHWDTTDTMLLSFVVFAYLIEVVFYLGIVRQYQFYGDQSIYSNVYNTIDDNINTEPITNRGKQLNVLLESTIDVIMKRNGSLEDVRQYFNANKSKFPGLDEGFIMSYAKSKMTDVANALDLNGLNLSENEAESYIQTADNYIQKLKRKDMLLDFPMENRKDDNEYSYNELNNYIDYE